MAIITSKLAKVVAVKIAQRAPFLKIGAKDYFSDQINSKMKAGQTYTFVIADAGSVSKNLDRTTDAGSLGMNQRSVPLDIQTYNNAVETGALEGITDLIWEEEVADQYAQKLINAVLADNVATAMNKASTAFVGSGFAPLAQAGAYVQSITTDKVVGFVDPMAQAVLAANGQSFVPNGQPNDLYSKGKLGIFQGVDYTAERFIKPVVISADAAAALTGAVATVDGDKMTVTLSATAKIPAGTPIMVEGIYACDTVGDATGSLFAFILDEDVTGSSIEIDLTKYDSTGKGTKEVEIPETVSDAVVHSITEAGTYRRAIVHAEGAKCWSPVEKLDFKWSEKYSEGSVDGINVMVNQFSDGYGAKNLTRWDMCFLAGIVEPRAVSVAYFKAENNLVNK